MFEPSANEIVDSDLLELERGSDSAGELGVHLGGVLLGEFLVWPDSDPTFDSTFTVAKVPDTSSLKDGDATDVRVLP